MEKDLTERCCTIHFNGVRMVAAVAMQNHQELKQVLQEIQHKNVLAFVVLLIAYRTQCMYYTTSVKLRCHQSQMKMTRYIALTEGKNQTSA